MTDTQLYDINKLRSYSAVFSSTHFANLLKKNDYSFLNSRIYADERPVKKLPITYLDYIKSIYANLQKDYRNEYVYKNTLINELLI